VAKSTRWNARLRAMAAVICVSMAAAATGGCGDDAESSGSEVGLRVTRDFGRALAVSENRAPLDGHGTVLRLLDDYANTTKSHHGLVIASINGLKHEPEDPSKEFGAYEKVWVLNVNGIESDVWPKDYKLFPGDVAQWDLRDWDVTLDVRATVGAFPETFSRGMFGRRFPVSVRCEKADSAPCIRVTDALRDAGVDPQGAQPPTQLPPKGQIRRASILVGAWRHWKDRPWPQRIQRGTRYSGVFARFAAGGHRLHLLDWNQKAVKTEGSGTGLIAAIRPTEEDLVWLVTGVDELGVDRASRGLNTKSLRDAFAVAVTDDGVEKLPMPPR